jgi:hypothetical protein
MRAGRIEIPVSIWPDEKEALCLLGVDLSQVRDACRALDGTLITSAIEGGCNYWKFRHPSIRDAIGAHVAAQPDLIDIYLSGARVEDILTEVVCGEATFQGAKVHIPANRFQRLLQKLRGIEVDDFWTTYVFVSFLYHRCPASFVQMWKHENNEQFNKLFTKALGRYEFSHLLAVLKEKGLLEEGFRRKYVKWAEEAILETVECQFLRRKVRALILDAEIDRIVARVKDELLPTLTDKLLAHEDSFDPEEVEPEDHFSEWRDNLEMFVQLYDDEEISESFREALDLIDDLEGRLSRVKEKHEKKKEEEEEEEEAQQIEEHSDDEYWHSEQSPQELEPASESFVSALFHPSLPRSIFDDVDL